MKLFLKLKHWQIFVVYLILYFLTIFFAKEYSQPGFLIISVYSSEFILLFIGFLTAYYYIVGFNLYNKIQKNIKMNILRFKITNIIPVFLCLIMILLEKSIDINENNISIFFTLYFFFMLFMGLCLMYSCIFVAKSLKSVETKKETKFSDEIVYFFLFSVLPLGIWKIQPKINKIFKNI